MLHNVLLPVADSPAFEAAFSTAMELLDSMQGEARVDALYVLSVSKRKGRFLRDLSGMMGFEPVLVPEAVESWYEQRGRELLDGVVARCDKRGHQAKALWDQGAVLERVLHRAAAADLVVVGAGEDGVLGLSGQGECTADRFLKRVSTTVLLAAGEKVNFSGICLAYDGSDGSNCALRSTRRLASIVGCPVHVVQALEGGIDSERHVVDEAVELLREEGVAVTSTVQVGEPHEVIQAECQEKGFGLVAVGYRGRVNLPGRVLGRVTESLVDELESALLVAR